MNRTASENPLGLGLIIVGAVAMAIAVFLPLDEPTGTFARVTENTLIQHGGWLAIGFALVIAYTGYRVSKGRRTERWAPIVLCVIAAGLIVLQANDKSTRTLYPVRPDGTVDTSQPGMVANLGVAIYVAGAGVALALIGSLILAQSAKQPVPDAADAPVTAKAATKKCPDCAETVLADAKVCKHCGYRFAAAADGKAESKPTSPQRQAAPHPPAKPHKTPEVKPRTNSPTSMNTLRPGDRVKVVLPGDNYDGKIGTVQRILGDGDVDVKLGVWSGTYTFGSDELEFQGRKIR